MDSEPNEENEFNKTMALAPMVIGMREILSDFRFKHLSTTSNWILAGTLAFIYSILSDPIKFVDSYGSWQTKLALICFSISFFLGIRVIIGSTAQTAIASSGTFKKIVEFNHALERSPNEETKEADQKQSLEQIAGEGLASTFIFHLKGTKSFWLQLMAFTVGAGIFFVTFMVKDFL